jgi:hypothetical protein
MITGGSLLLAFKIFEGLPGLSFNVNVRGYLNVYA